ncbi:uncharacterized protein LOC135714154 [Ochlerotatus camptorhynchus]|uniref:uncharacterized protein LOC135714154 n=1 Tax=Ochlerotatus camptorhynchus TaxID=644619 RepID=UPI0031E32B14
MASASDPVICTNCSAVTLAESVALCTGCDKSCCSKCSREPSDSVSLFSVPHILCLACYRDRRQKEGIVTCPLHPERTLDLYCLTCNLQICYDCFVLLPEHKRHTIDTVEVIYRQKLLETVEKFRKIPQRLKLIDWEAIRQVDDNLKIVQNVEQNILNEIQQLIHNRTAVMLGKTAEKKRTLIGIKEYVLQMELQNRQMLQQIRDLNTSDFLRQQEVLNERCERILNDVEQLQVQSVTWDDIQCDLLPACTLEPIVLNVPLDGDQSNKRVPFQLEDDCGIQWITICHIRATSIVLEMYPNLLVGDFNFRAVVEISHLNQMKMTSKTFTFREKLLPTELIPLDELQNSGFLSKAGDLRLKIGIRSENIVEENILVKKLLLEQRKATGHLQMELAAVKDQNFIQQGDMMRSSCEMKRLKDLYETQTMVFKRQIKELKLAADERPSTPGSSINVPLTPTEVDKQKLNADLKRLQAKLESMQIAMKSMNPYAIGSFEIYRCSKDNKFYSPQLTAYNGVTIYVIVQPNFSAESKSDVNAYICLAKGARNKCQIFLEVLNECEEANIREDRVFDFSKGTSFTWKSVISHYALYRDEGFLVNDHLKIKFGLRPLLE